MSAQVGRSEGNIFQPREEESKVDNGYVKRIIFAVKDFFTDIFYRIFSWFSGKDRVQKEPDEYDALIQKLQKGQGIEENFKHFFSYSDRKKIFTLLGDSIPYNWMDLTTNKVGFEMYKKLPALILFPLLQKVLYAKENGLALANNDQDDSDLDGKLIPANDAANAEEKGRVVK
jgi:hypothetical protein